MNEKLSPHSKTSIAMMLNTTAEKSRKNIGTLLKEHGLVHEQQIAFALQQQKVTGQRLGDLFEQLGFVSAYDIATVLAGQENLNFVDVRYLEPEPEALKLFNMKLCLVEHFLPLRCNGDVMEVVTASTNLNQLSQLLLSRSGLQPRFLYGQSSEINQAIRQYYYFLENPLEALLDKEIELATADHDMIRSLGGLLNQLFYLAIKYRATDIHIRPGALSIQVSFRIDGVLRSMFCMHPRLKRFISTIKLKSGIDISEHRLPQDGSFTETILEQTYDLRVSTIVGLYGESVVIRILHRDNAVKGFPELGFSTLDQRSLNRMFSQPSGLILLTGPTGSGKTTTLYAGLSSMNLLEKNILTVEDPVEYQIPLATQTEVNRRSGYHFEHALTHFLRHDPDVMLVGEIRNTETAITALTAAETGHLVLSTLHVNSAYGVIPRLLSLGVSAHVLADSLVGVINQRLVRILCVHCKSAYTANEEEKIYLDHATVGTLYRAEGCETCRGTGYMGRMPIYEMLRVSQGMPELIIQGAGRHEIESLAVEHGFRSIFEMATDEVLKGVLSVEELMRVLGDDGS